eukprot:s1589_g7.t1
MPSIARADLILKLEQYGESPPSHWTVMQMKGRLAELKASQAPGTTLKDKLTLLNKLAKKKANIYQYAVEQGVSVTENMTIAQIYAVLEVHVTLETPAVSTDVMNFGKHQNATYMEVLMEHPSYVTWAKTTVAESSDTCWRLRRFVEWANNTKPNDLNKMPPKVALQPRTKGYKVSGMSSRDHSGDSSDASFSLVEDQLTNELEELCRELEITKKEKSELGADLGLHQEPQGDVSGSEVDCEASELERYPQQQCLECHKHIASCWKEERNPLTLSGCSFLKLLAQKTVH